MTGTGRLPCSLHCVSGFCPGCARGDAAVGRPSSRGGRPRIPPLPRRLRGGWIKSGANPVLGADLGTCFDVSVLKESDTFRMWFSWRPRKSLALTESKDGIHWSQPQIVLGPNPATGWEDDINRPCVIKGQDGYHLWYTGQARGHSAIGYATSDDGKACDRRSSTPVLTPDHPWEKVAVMCPTSSSTKVRTVIACGTRGARKTSPTPSVMRPAGMGFPGPRIPPTPCSGPIRPTPGRRPRHRLPGASGGWLVRDVLHWLLR